MNLPHLLIIFLCLPLSLPLFYAPHGLHKANNITSLHGSYNKTQRTVPKLHGHCYHMKLKQLRVSTNIPTQVNTIQSQPKERTPQSQQKNTLQKKNIIFKCLDNTSPFIFTHYINTSQNCIHRSCLTSAYQLLPQVAEQPRLQSEFFVLSSHRICRSTNLTLHLQSETNLDFSTKPDKSKCTSTKFIM